MTGCASRRLAMKVLWQRLLSDGFHFFYSKASLFFRLASHRNAWDIARSSSIRAVPTGRQSTTKNLCDRLRGRKQAVFLTQGQRSWTKASGERASAPTVILHESFLIFSRPLQSKVFREWFGPGGAPQFHRLSGPGPRGPPHVSVFLRPRWFEDARVI